MSGPFKLKGWSPFTQKEFKLKVGKGQGSKRKGKYILDPDAPGGKYGPGYEPPVTDKEMKGLSPFTQIKPEKEGEGKYHYKKSEAYKRKTHPKKEAPPEHKDLSVTKSNKIERINDIEDRIQFLRDDINEGNMSADAGNKKIKTLKAALAKAKG